MEKKNGSRIKSGTHDKCGMTFMIRVAYDGTNYQGWQVQPNGPTVAGTLLATFERVFGQSCVMVGASRTDSGVHAYDQVARVRTDLVIDADKLKLAWNNALPDDIVIRVLSAVDERFHPHHGVIQKEYQYQIFTSRPLPFVARFGWWPQIYMPQFQHQLFEQALQQFIGAHDFTAFSKQEPGKDPVRTVDAIAVQACPDEEMIRVSIKAKGFLRYQIRRMIGAAVVVASSDELSVADIAQLLQQPTKKRHAMLKAESRGLCLRSITYEKDV